LFFVSHGPMHDDRTDSGVFRDVGHSASGEGTLWIKAGFGVGIRTAVQVLSASRKNGTIWSLGGTSGTIQHFFGL